MFLKLIFIILYCMFLIDLCSPKTTTEKKTKTTTTKSTRTKVSTTSMAKPKLVECYQSFKGYYENKFYNVSSPIKCKTNCYTYKESLGSESQEAGSCNDQTSCLGGIFLVKYNYSFIYDCCDWNLCNSPEYSVKALNYKCEFNKVVPKTKKLTFPVGNPRLPTVKQCYYCNGCSSPKGAKPVNCVERNATVKNFACLHSYANTGQTQYWSGDCISADEMVHVSYQKVNAKVVTCQTDLCNSPTAVQKLDTAILCRDGFYM